MKPFAVIDSAGGSVFSDEIAKRKIVMAFGSTGSQAADLAQQPYRFTGADVDLQAKNVSAWLGRQIAGRKAAFAGDPNFQKETRKFGLLYTISPTSGNTIDLDKFKADLAKQGVPKLAAEVAWSPPADSSSGAQTSAAQEQAPTLVAKLKDAGVTSVILMGSSTIVAPMTKAATANEYRPEWLMTAWAYQELSLFAAQYDQDQWGHAFGMSWFAPYATDQAGAVTAENVVNWYWGTNKGTTYSGGMPAVYWINQGVQLAGPKLTPTSFRDGQFAQPGSGGAFQDEVTTQGNKVGDLGLGYPEYALLGPKDFALGVVRPESRGEGQHHRQPADRQLLVPRRWQAVHPPDVEEGATQVLHEAADRRRELHDVATEGHPAAVPVYRLPEPGRDPAAGEHAVGEAAAAGYPGEQRATQVSEQAARAGYPGEQRATQVSEQAAASRVSRRAASDPGVGASGREPGIPASSERPRCRSERPRAGYPGEQRATQVSERAAASRVSRRAASDPGVGASGREPDPGDSERPVSERAAASRVSRRAASDPCVGASGERRSP